MLRNPFRTLQELLADPPLQVGEVIAIDDHVVTVEMPGGGQVAARGPATVGQNVFVQGGVIQGEAPSLSIEVIEV